MCGIAGLIAEKDLVVRDALTGMTNAQCHRGPDDSGIDLLPFGDRALGFGHRRLSIIDLSSAGHQPMVHPKTGDQIVFNGEIYNFPRIRRELDAEGEHFTGHSDTEVLLHGLSRWGPEFLKRLQGMFALGFYNAREQSLLLARDSVGIKPLYIARVNGAFLFASEVRAILASNLVERRLDMRGVAGLLAYAAVQHPYTLFQQIQSFPPGHYQVFHPTGNGATSAPTAFWTFPKVREDAEERDVVARVRTTLEAAVRDHLIADVPVGVFLSSGLDSTTVAALAAKHTSHLRSFSVGFADQPDMSELALAKETAQLFELDHTEILVNNDDAEHAAVEWMQSLDLPSVDGLNVYIIAKVVRAHGIKVALSGQGGDELFGGYPGTFYEVPRLSRWMHLIDWLPHPMRRALGSIATAGSSEAVKHKVQDMLRSNGAIAQLYLQRRRAMSTPQLADLGLDPAALGLSDTFIANEIIRDLPGDDADPIWAASQLETRFYQHNMLLRDADTNGMAHSLEIRVPLLDQRLLDLMMPLPQRVRLPNGIADKHLMRLAMAPYFRQALLNQPKRGFGLPIRRWMMGPMRQLCEDAIASLKQVGALRTTGIDAIWASFLAAPESPIWSRAFTLVVLGDYLRRMKITG